MSFAEDVSRKFHNLFGKNLISDYRNVNGYVQAMDMDDEGDDSHNVPSDIDSQVS